jgi:anaerobic selenocysteine-containing dehydrogenase
VIPREQRRRQHLLTVRRLREVVNTTGHHLSKVRQRRPYNPAYLHPDELAALRVVPGDIVELVTDHGRLRAVVDEDDTLRSGVVSMSHGWGNLPDTDDDPHQGACTNLLVRTDRDTEMINGMPVMSAIPVSVVKAL